MYGAKVVFAVELIEAPIFGAVGSGVKALVNLSVLLSAVVVSIEI